MEQNNIEIWKPVAGYEGRYEVSNLGRFRNLPMTVVLGPHTRDIPMRVRLGTKGRFGYRFVLLHHPDTSVKPLRRAVHRLVALAFIEANPDPELVVNHINFVTDDNRVENLELVTQTGNMQHSAAAGRLNLLGIKKYKTNAETLAAIRREACAGDLDATEIAEACGSSRSTVMRVMAGKICTSGKPPERLVPSNPWSQAGRRKKLTPDDVLAIKSMAGTLSNPKIGALFGVSAPTVWGIINGKYWKAPI